MGAQENIKIVQGLYEAFGRQDMDSVLATFAEDVEWHNFEANPFGGVHRGHDGIRETLELIAQTDLTKFEIDRILSDDEKTVALLMIGYTVKATGKSTEGLTVHVFEFEGDKIACVSEVAASDGGAWAA